MHTEILIEPSFWLQVYIQRIINRISYEKNKKSLWENHTILLLFWFTFRIFVFPLGDYEKESGGSVCYMSSEVPEHETHVYYVRLDEMHGKRRKIL